MVRRRVKGVEERYIFGESKDVFVLGMDGLFGEDPVDLIGRESAGEALLGFEIQGGKDGGH